MLVFYFIKTAVMGRYDLIIYNMMTICVSVFCSVLVNLLRRRFVVFCLFDLMLLWAAIFFFSIFSHGDSFRRTGEQCRWSRQLMLVVASVV